MKKVQKSMNFNDHKQCTFKRLATLSFNRKEPVSEYETSLDDPIKMNISFVIIATIIAAIVDIVNLVYYYYRSLGAEVISPITYILSRSLIIIANYASLGLWIYFIKKAYHTASKYAELGYVLLSTGLFIYGASTRYFKLQSVKCEGNEFEYIFIGLAVVTRITAANIFIRYGLLKLFYCFLMVLALMIFGLLDETQDAMFIYIKGFLTLLYLCFLVFLTERIKAKTFQMKYILEQNDKAFKEIMAYLPENILILGKNGNLKFANMQLMNYFEIRDDKSFSLEKLYNIRQITQEIEFNQVITNNAHNSNDDMHINNNNNNRNGRNNNNDINLNGKNNSNNNSNSSNTTTTLKIKTIYDNGQEERYINSDNNNYLLKRSNYTTINKINHTNTNNAVHNLSDVVNNNLDNNGNNPSNRGSSYESSNRDENSKVNTGNENVSKPKQIVYNTLTQVIEYLLNDINYIPNLNKLFTFHGSYRDQNLDSSRLFEIKIKPSIIQQESYLIIILRDITEREIIASLEDSNNYKNDLLASFSHELRTPLNSQINYLEVAITDPLLHNQIKFSYLIPALRSCKLLKHLINDILDLSSITNQSIVIDTAGLSLQSTLVECLELIELQAFKKKVKLELEIDPKLPNIIFTDHNKVSQIVVNLLANSMKFTDENGKIKAIVHFEKPNVIISVVDTGIGMTPDEIIRLRERLNNHHKYRRINKNSNGVGMGLAISHILAKLIGPKDGDGLFFESQKHLGSKFSFIILDRSSTDNILDIEEYPTIETDTTNKNSSKNEFPILNQNHFKAKTVPNFFVAQPINKLLTENRLTESKIPIGKKAKIIKINDKSNNYGELNIISNKDKEKCIEKSRCNQIIKKLNELDYKESISNIEKNQIIIGQVNDFGKISEISLTKDNEIIETKQILLTNTHSDMLKSENQYVKTLRAKLKADFKVLPEVNSIQKIENGDIKNSIHSGIKEVVYNSKTYFSNDNLNICKKKSNENNSPSINAIVGDEYEKKISKFENNKKILEKKCTCPQILIVDDDSFNIMSMEYLLKRLGYTYSSAFNGQLAINEILRREARPCNELCEQYKLILMDFSMPVMNGVEATKILKAKMKDGLIKPIIILACTAFVGSDKKKECMDAGMDDFISKPINFTKLKDILKHYIPNKINQD